MWKPKWWIEHLEKKKAKEQKEYEEWKVKHDSQIVYILRFKDPEDNKIYSCLIPYAARFDVAFDERSKNFHLLAIETHSLSEPFPKEHYFRELYT